MLVGEDRVDWYRFLGGDPLADFAEAAEHLEVGPSSFARSRRAYLEIRFEQGCALYPLFRSATSLVSPKLNPKPKTTNRKQALSETTTHETRGGCGDPMRRGRRGSRNAGRPDRG